jgi:glycosyltransferase involved in cell wall biosynthesis
MRAEYLKHGFAPENVYNLSYYAKQTGGTFDLNAEEELLNDSTPPHEAPTVTVVDEETKFMKPPNWRLLFLGRMDFLKGGHVFLNALPIVSAALKQPLEITFAGDGPQRKAWERQAASVQRRNQDVRIKFTGWVSGSKREALWNNCDLLVVPSVWPEPFGLVGPEAGLHGVPIAAFAVGGITDWLSSGVNGFLADGDPPTSAGLAEAIIRCCCDPEIHAHLRRGAEAMAHRFNIKNHLTGLLSVFEKVLGTKGASEVNPGFQRA